MHFQHNMCIRALLKRLGGDSHPLPLAVELNHILRVLLMLSSREGYTSSDVLRLRNASKEEVEKAMKTEEETVKTYLRGRRLRNLMFADANPIGHPRPTPPRKGYYKTIL